MYKQHPDVLLLDSTYKTNRFNMPLLNICAITGSNKVIQVGLVFLSFEKESDYNWAISCLRTIMYDNMIQELLSIVTDRELALIKCLETWFPKSRHLLCRWHVNMNVLAKTKKHFPGPVKQANGTYCRHPSFQSFLTDWNALLSCTTLSLYNELLQKMRQNHPPLAMSYCEGTWLL